MPIPAPSKGETREKFVSRCMGNEVMKKEFPENKQRLAVCFGKWKEHNKKDKASEVDHVQELIEAFLAKHPELKTEEIK